MDEICSLNIHLYIDIPQKVLLKSLHAQKKGHFFTEFANSVLNPFIRKQLAHGEIIKYFFLHHFSSSFIGEKYSFQVHIPF